MLTPEIVNECVNALMQLARSQPNNRAEIRDQTGAVVGYIEAIVAPKRPQDMPRHLRPKARLSKRGRVAAKHEKLAARS